jgi:hypothetical protein
MGKIINKITGISWNDNYLMWRNEDFEYLENPITWQEYLSQTTEKYEDGYTPLDYIYYRGKNSPGSRSYFLIGTIGTTWYLYDIYDVDGTKLRVYNEANCDVEFGLGVWNITSSWPLISFETSDQL